MPARACVPSLGKRELARAPWRGSSLGKWSRSALTDPLPPLPPSLPPALFLSLPSFSLFLSPYTHTLSIISFIRAYAYGITHSNTGLRIPQRSSEPGRAVGRVFLNISTTCTTLVCDIERMDDMMLQNSQSASDGSPSSIDLLLLIA